MCISFSQNAPSPACLFEMKVAKGINNVCYLSFVFVMLSCILIAVTCLEMANLLALLCLMFYCVVVTFPCGVLGRMWHLIVSMSDLCLLIYFYIHQAMLFHW